MFHLGWFTNFMPPKSWRTHWEGHDAEEWATGKFYVDFAKSPERACFDYMTLEDSLMVPDIFGGTAEVELKHSLYEPKHDPVHLAPLLANATDQRGIIATMSTSFYPPFMFARTLAHPEPSDERARGMEHRHVQRAPIRTELRDGRAVAAR